MKYAVIEETHTTIPGDERSRTHPGHGYPEHTQTSTKFQDAIKLIQRLQRSCHSIRRNESQHRSQYFFKRIKVRSSVVKPGTLM
jgi:hypothetical protein